jgi:hypothetical protein
MPQGKRAAQSIEQILEKVSVAQRGIILDITYEVRQGNGRNSLQRHLKAGE